MKAVLHTATIFCVLFLCCLPAFARQTGNASHTRQHQHHAVLHHRGHETRGMASWYGKQHHGTRTACGERFDCRGYTAAHKTLPFGTIVRVTNLKNHKSVDVRITDRGPFSRKFIIDISEQAAHKIGMYHSGIGHVELDIVHLPASARASRNWHSETGRLAMRR